MENLIVTAGQYGALGLTLLASFWYINKKDGEHKEERQGVAERLEQMHKEALEVTKNNTIVLTEISTLIKDK